MATKYEALAFLETEVEGQEKRVALDFDEYLSELQKDPQRVLRNIFQLFYDMVKGYVGEGIDEYPDDPESIGFVKYDCARLFAEGADSPFFADRLFANRFIRQIESLRQGFQQNRIYAYDGPSGCGKSTFLNNLLQAFETYTKTQEGRSYEILWEIDERVVSHESATQKKLRVPCPSHDSPVLIIPKEYRKSFLKRLLPAEKAESMGVFREKEHEWILRGEVCTICKSIFEELLGKLESLRSVLDMVKVRPYPFDRRVGEGISVFNPGDKPMWGMKDGQPIDGFFTNAEIQEKLDQMFGANAVRYVYSLLAKTNNGVYVLMDVKGHNADRLLELHNVISEGVHKVAEVEERVNSLFFALMNPEDKGIIEERKMESLQRRIQYNKVPYVLEPATEVSIYGTVFGETIRGYFLPRILENFAKVIISSRMNLESKPLKEWIPNLGAYKRYCDEQGLLLRMEIYGGVIPDWLSEEDRKKFTAPVRRAMVAEGENEGSKGLSGTGSIVLFSEFFNRYRGRPSLISMDNVTDFFKNRVEKERRDDHIPKNFLVSLVDAYDYAALNEMKQALYFYNTEQIRKDILNYLWAINYDVGVKITCRYTGDEFTITNDFLRLMGTQFTGRVMSEYDAVRYAQDIQKKYVVAVSKDQLPVTETDLYLEFFAAYVKNLREKVLQPFVGNPNFRATIQVLGTKEFDSFDTRLREHVTYMIKNLIEKFGYTEQGAKEICLYVLDKNLTQKFA